MKILVFLLAVLAAAAAPTFAQGAWVLQPTPNDMPAGGATALKPSIRFFGTLKGWALSATGRLLRTVDGGKTWVQLAPPESGPNSMSFINADTGWIATSKNGNLYRTTDAGNTWTLQPGGRGGLMQVAYFVNADSGWEFIHTSFAKTSDGGETWSPGYSDPTFTEFRKAHFPRSGTAWCLMQNQVAKKDTGVYKWTVVSTVPNPADQNDIFFADSNRGWIAGKGGTLHRTDDQGKTWTPLVTGTQKALEALYFTDRDNGWAVGEKGTALRTQDGGATWTSYPADTSASEDLVAVHFIDARTGWALGSWGNVFRTDTAVVTAVRGSSGAGARGGDNVRLFLKGTTLRYDLGRSGRATLTLHALDGTRETVLFDGFASAGAHELDLAGRGLSTGIHVLRFTGDGQRRLKTIFIP